MPTRCSVIVPTLGSSRWLVPCLDALRRDGGDEIEILLVSQGKGLEAAAESLADRVLRPASNLGFAAAVNLAAAAASGEYLAPVNDDAVVEAGWCRRLLAALDGDGTVAAVQGINLMMEDPALVDGAGLAWNRFWQAIQIGRGGPSSALPGETLEIFGVSATAAIYRRAALPEHGPFDAELFAYYEDVDLACRLRAAGHRALRVPSARVRHAGSVSGKRLRWGRHRLIYGNRHLVLARLLGRAYWPRCPLILLRDLIDLGRAALRADARTAAGIFAGAARALGHGARFARLGEPLIPLLELRRFPGDPATPQGSSPGAATDA